MRQYFDLLLAFNPEMLIVHFGDDVRDDASFKTDEAMLKTIIDEYASPNISYIPCVNDPVEAWYRGTGYTSSKTGTGNMDNVCEESTHFTYYGCNYQAMRWYNALCGWLDSQ
jgi:hypothetical protein